MITIIILLILSAFFSLSEMAFISCDWIILRRWVRRSIPGAKMALESLRKLDKLLTIILIGNTLTVVGISIVAKRVFEGRLPDLLIILLTGLLIFIVGELLPKYLALRGKEVITLILILPYRIIYWTFYQLIFVVYKSSTMVLRLFKSPIPSTFHRFTREDLLIASGRTLPLREYNILSRLLEFREHQAKEIMVPKHKMVAAPSDISISKLQQLAASSGYSKIPIYKDNINEIIGVVEVKSLLPLMSETAVSPLPLKQCRFIDENAQVDGLLEGFFDESHSFFAIVKDKHNKTCGLITMEDILEELFGEIEDEYDKI
ncbi:MAG: DUF21 domain-containing protein [Candidatus Stahlbacteria bacterium]|nr:DUF21 domain-containing protein [Candidatus Stahlbacteria bacterium]